jgi:signal transduction histidine kinase
VIARARELLRLPRRDREEATVLVVDDSPTFREQLRGALEQRGHHVLLAGSAEEGLRLAAAHRPSAMLVDATLPAMDGHALIRRIRLDEALRGTRCLLLTAQEGERVELNALDSGADAFARKEESLDTLLARLAALLRGARTRRSELPSSPAPQRLLLVDASAAEPEARVGVLRDEGFDVALARSASEAIELLVLQRIDCILLDWGQTPRGGAEICRSIKAAPGAREIPLLVLSSDDGGGTLLDALGEGADDVIARSADAEVLLARIRARLRRRLFEEESRQVREDLLRSQQRVAESSAARQIAEAASRAKSEFLSAMSHELRTPLNAILGFAQLLARDRREPLSERHQQRVQQILDGGKHLLRLIEDILDLSRIEASGVSISIQRVEVMPRLQEVLANLSLLAAQSSLELRVACELRELPPIAADPTRFTQILMNLGSNAIKYNRPNGSVLFEVSLPGADRLRVRVRDTGLGIPEELQDRLFQPFQRMGQEAGPIEGTGIGLVITRELARRMHGDVGFRSASGVGSEFWVDLPLLPESG